MGLASGSELGLSDRQLRRVNRLEKTEDDLGLPLPKRPYRKSKDSIQTRAVPQLSTWVMLASFGGQIAQLEERFPNWVMQNRSGLLELLIRSLTIYNETHVALVSRFSAIFPSLSIEELVRDNALWEEASRRSIPNGAGVELEQAMLETAPFRVALTLLAEPLRAYGQLTRQQPEHARLEIDSDNLDENAQSDCETSKHNFSRV